MTESTSTLGPPAGPATPPSRWTGATPWVAIALGLSPFIAAIAAWTGRSWTPTQDMAVIDLRVRDVFTSSIPLVGPYSRYGWNHPGPFEFWTVSLFGLPFGHPAWATLVGHVLLQAVPLLALGAIVARRSRSAAVAGALLVGCCYAATGTWMVIEPWNPHVAFAWWIVWLATLTGIAMGDRRALVASPFVASVLIQLHLGYVPLVVATGAVGVVWAARPLVGSFRESTRFRRWAIASVVGTVLLWVPPVIDEFVHRPGNLERTIDFFRASGGRAVGLAFGARVIADEFALPPQWLGRGSSVDPFTGALVPPSAWWLLVAVALLAVAAVCARGLGRLAMRLVILDVVALAAGILAISRITDVPRAYLFYWRIPLGAFVWASALAIIAARALAVRPVEMPIAVRHVGLIALTVVLAIRIAPLTQSVATSPPHVSRSPGIENVTASFISRTENRARQRGPILLRFAGETLQGLHGGLFNGLVREGADIRTGPAGGFQFGYRRARLQGVEEVWYAVEGGPAVAQLATSPGATVIAETTPLDRASEARLRRLQLELTPLIVAAGRSSELEKLGSPLVSFAFADVPGASVTELDELGSLNERLAGTSCRCAVIAFPKPLDPGTGDDAGLFAN